MQDQPLGGGHPHPVGQIQRGLGLAQARQEIGPGGGILGQRGDKTAHCRIVHVLQPSRGGHARPVRGRRDRRPGRVRPAPRRSAGNCPAWAEGESGPAGPSPRTPATGRHCLVADDTAPPPPPSRRSRKESRYGSAKRARPPCPERRCWRKSASPPPRRQGPAPVIWPRISPGITRPVASVSIGRSLSPSVDTMLSSRWSRAQSASKARARARPPRVSTGMKLSERPSSTTLGPAAAQGPGQKVPTDGAVGMDPDPPPGQGLRAEGLDIAGDKGRTDAGIMADRTRGGPWRRRAQGGGDRRPRPAWRSRRRRCRISARCGRPGYGFR